LRLLGTPPLLVPPASMPGHTDPLRAAAVQTPAMHGSPAALVAHHVAGLDLLVIQAASLQGPTALAMFLLGMVAARRRMFSGLGGQPGVLWNAQRIGFAVGVPGGVLYALVGGDTNTWATTVSVVTAPFLTAAYVATLIRLMHAPGGTWVRSALAPVGRIALTNYLGQSLVGIILFTGVGFGLAGQVSPPLLLVLAVIVFAAQAMLSAWWLHHHRYGPAEYLLRSLTNWSRPWPAKRSTGKREAQPSSESA